MDAEQALNGARNWALQTVIFVLTSGDGGQGALEVAEIMGHRGHVIRDQLFAKAMEECGQGANFRLVIETLARRTLDWVVRNHKPKS